MISKSKATIVCGIARIGLQRWVENNGECGARQLVLHRFFGESESQEHARERLKRFCDWLQNNYTLISAAAYLTCLKEQRFPRNALFVTLDDGRSRILPLIDIFRDFEIPLTVFAATGWTDGAQPAKSEPTLPQLIAFLEHYRGENRQIPLPDGQSLSLGSGQRGDEIDRLITMADGSQQFVSDVWDRIPDAVRAQGTETGICNWSELTDLAAMGFSIGSHSLSHCRMARQSPLRIQYELCESRRILTARFGQCPIFAYPYGTWDVYNDLTTAAVRAAGYECAFLTHGGDWNRKNRYALPRIDIPDQQISDRLFAALVQGGQLPLIRIKNFLTRRHVSDRTKF
ncbi:MAG: polysaccharide deacetylase family protein [Fuerstiella sp.]